MQLTFPGFNTIGFPKTINDWDQYNVRLDHHFTSRDVVYGTFSDSNETLLKPALRPLGGDIFPANQPALHSHLHTYCDPRQHERIPLRL